MGWASPKKRVDPGKYRYTVLDFTGGGAGRFKSL